MAPASATDSSQSSAYKASSGSSNGWSPAHAVYGLHDEEEEAEAHFSAPVPVVFFFHGGETLLLLGLGRTDDEGGTRSTRTAVAGVRRIGVRQPGSTSS